MYQIVLISCATALALSLPAPIADDSTIGLPECVREYNEGQTEIGECHKDAQAGKMYYGHYYARDWWNTYGNPFAAWWYAENWTEELADLPRESAPESQYRGTECRYEGRRKSAEKIREALARRL